MLLVRSVFWLTVAFFVIKPGVDIETTAQTLRTDAVAVGQQMLSDTIASTDCTDLTCVGGKAVLAAVLQPATSAAPTMQGLPAPVFVPVPRPRPDRAG